MSLPAKVVIDQTIIKANVTSTTYKVTISQLGPAKVTVQAGLPGPAGATGPQGPPGPSGGTGGLSNKCGIVAGGSFSGTPKKYAIVFVTPFLNTNYAILITGTDGRSYTYESKTVNGFTINANANSAISGEVSWVATIVGESS